MTDSRAGGAIFADAHALFVIARPGAAPSDDDGPAAPPAAAGPRRRRRRRRGVQAVSGPGRREECGPDRNQGSPIIWSLIISSFSMGSLMITGSQVR